MRGLVGWRIHDGPGTRPPVCTGADAAAYLSLGLVSSLPGLMCWSLWSMRGSVGALEGWGVSADAQAYFGARLGLAPGRRHDV